jgi:hypothetical protein
MDKDKDTKDTKDTSKDDSQNTWVFDPFNWMR